jgi:hypothetical protein
MNTNKVKASSLLVLLALWGSCPNDGVELI